MDRNDPVLIETLWNVKEITAIQVIRRNSGINRNIVECKDKSYMNMNFFCFVLIETLWNVKLYNSRKGIWSNVVLIETLWNVKQIASSVHP